MDFKNKPIISILNTNDEDGHLTKTSVSAKITESILRAFFDPEFLSHNPNAIKVLIISTKDEDSDKSVQPFVKGLLDSPAKKGFKTLFAKQLDVPLVQEKDQMSKSFEENFSCLADGSNNRLIIHSTKKTRQGLGIDGVASFYENKIYEFLGLKKNENADVNLINIRYFFNCDNISKEIGFSNGVVPHLGELIIYRETEDNCYSSVISNNFNRLRKGCGVSSVTLISKDIFKDKVAGEEISISKDYHYFPKNRVYQIKKGFFDTSEISDLHDTILRWMKIHLVAPTAFFSYGTQDKSDPNMEKLSNSMEQYFPNINIRKDKAIDHYGGSLKDITEKITSSNIVFFIIGKGFLESEWAMRELLGFIENKNIADPNINEETPVENYSKEYGLILLVLESAQSYIYEENSMLADYWKEVIKSNDKDNIKSKSCEEIFTNSQYIKNILKDYYTYKIGKGGDRKNFKQIALLISKYLERHELEHPYKYYLDQEKNEYFPEIE